MKNILSYIKNSQLRRLLYPLLFFGIAALVLVLLPITDRFRLRSVNDTEPLSASVNDGIRYVKTTGYDLYYTGEDYYVDNVLTGHYYYQLTGNYCRFYILKPSAGKPAEAYVAGRAVSGKLERTDANSSALLADFAATLGWSVEGLSAISDPYLVNEAVFFPAYEIVLFVIILLAALVGLVGFFYTLLLALFPKLSIAYQRLRKYGDPDQIIRDVNLELAQELILRKKNIALTPRYLIGLQAERTAIVPLESVLWIFSFQTLRYSLRYRRRKMYYALRIVTITGDAFTLRDLSKEDIDQVLSLLSERYPNFFYDYSEEHDRMVRYILRENRRELRRK